MSACHLPLCLGELVSSYHRIARSKFCRLYNQGLTLVSSHVNVSLSCNHQVFVCRGMTFPVVWLRWTPPRPFIVYVLWATNSSWCKESCELQPGRHMRHGHSIWNYVVTFHLNLIVKAPFFGNDVGHHIQYFLIQRDLASFIQLSSKELGDAIVHILRSEHLKGIMYLKDASAGLNVKPLPLCA